MVSLKARFFYHVVKRRLAKFRALKLPLPEARALRDKASAQLFKLPPGLSLEAAQLGGLPGEWLRPEGAGSAEVVLYLHGGGYVQGSLDTHRGLAANLARASAASTYIVGYRLAPEHPFPAALDDAMAVYAALQAQAPGRRIALAGDSAGAGLALACALRIRAEGRMAPVALALMSPWTDLSLSNASHLSQAAVDPYFPNLSILRGAAAAYLADGAHGDVRDPLVSPQFADLRGLPPTLIHVGELEALLDDSRVLAQKMGAALAVYPGMWHVWQAFGGRFREADHSLAALGAFVRRQFEAAASAQNAAS